MGVDLLPGGRASISIGAATAIDGPAGKETVKLAYITGTGFAPRPVWLDKDHRFFGFAGEISLLPAGYEKAGPQLKKVQEATEAGRRPRRQWCAMSPANS